MATRILAGNDLGLVPRLLAGKLEPDYRLNRDGQRWSFEGFWTRTSGGESSVIIVPNTGSLGTVRPIAGDQLEIQGETLRIESVGGIDGVIWSATCTQALDQTIRPAAPRLVLTTLSSRTFRASIDRLPIGGQVKTRIRPALSPYWQDALVLGIKVRIFQTPTTPGVYEVGAMTLSAGGVGSLNAIEVLEVT